MYMVVFRDERGWHVTGEYPTAERALEAQEAFAANYNAMAYALRIESVVEKVPSAVLNEVAQIVKRGWHIVDLLANRRVIRSGFTKNEDAWVWLTQVISEQKLPGRTVAAFLVEEVPA